MRLLTTLITLAAFSLPGTASAQPLCKYTCAFSARVDGFRGVKSPFDIATYDTPIVSAYDGRVRLTDDAVDADCQCLWLYGRHVALRASTHSERAPLFVRLMSDRPSVVRVVVRIRR